MNTRTESLVAAVCPDPSHSLAAPLRAWCLGSRPFLAFAEANVPKLRKKAREAVDEGAQADLLAELVVAAWVLRGPALGLSYEPLKAGGGRGPDYALALPGGAIYIEVARLRGGGSQAPEYKLARVLADKAGQLPAGAGTVLAAVLPSRADAAELAPAALRLLAQAAQGAAFPGLPSERARTFERLRSRLGGVLCLGPGDFPEVTLWTHAGAAHPLTSAALRRLQQ